MLSTLSQRTRRFGPVAGRHVDARLSALPQDGVFDLVSDYAEPLAADMIASLYGVADAQRADLVRWMTDFSLGFEIHLDEGRVARFRTATRYLNAFLKASAASRRTRPTDNWISDLATSTDLTDVEIMHSLRMTVLASFFPLSALISSTVHLLLANPSEMAKVRADPSLCAAAIEEALRFDPPGEAVSRGSFEGVELAGRRVEPFRQMEVLIRTANHDPTVYEDPDVFRIDAGRRNHLAFGSGYRMCPGAAFARAMAQVAVSGLL